MTSSMAIKQTLIHRMFTICNNHTFSNQTLRNCRISATSTTSTTAAASAAAPRIFTPPNPDRVAPDRGEDSMFRRFFHRNPVNLTSTATPEILRPRNESMLQRLKEIDITRNRIRLDVLSPPPERSTETEFTAADAKKILRVSLIEKLKEKLNNNRKNHVSYDEFIQICVEQCGNRDLGLDLAKVLDDSGSVIVLGDVVFLKPNQGRMRNQISRNV